MAQGFDELIQFVDDFNEKLLSATIIAGQGLLGDLLNRVHREGRATDGSPIGSGGYSRTPFYAAMDDFINRGSIPKDKVSKNGKWVQLPEGYKSFREYSGRQTDFVDLKYTGTLQNSMLLVQTENGFAIGYPQQNQPGDEGTREGTDPATLSLELEERYGKDIFAASQSEIDNFLGDIIYELNR